MGKAEKPRLLRGGQPFGMVLHGTMQVRVPMTVAKEADTVTDRATVPIIRATGLTKRFKRASKPPGLRGALIHLVKPRYTTMTAVDDIDLEILPGESVAYVGPNGAGKSTTVKLLTGILVPSEGEVEVCGISPWQHRIENAFNMGGGLRAAYPALVGYPGAGVLPAARRHLPVGCSDLCTDVRCSGRGA